MQQRRTNRQKRLENIKNTQNEKDNDEDDALILNINQNENKRNPKMSRQQFKLNKIKNKLLEKQNASRSTKIAPKKQIKTHQNELEKRNERTKSVFCDDWNNNNLISLHHNGDTVNMRNFVGKYECFDGYKPKYLQFTNQSGTEMEVINVEYDEKQEKYVEIEADADDNGQNAAEYDLYELDENANGEDILAAIQMRMEHKTKQSEQTKEVEHEMKVKDECKNEDALDLEWRLEKIKNKHLAKHFDANYEGPTFGYNDVSKQSENARYIEIEQSDFSKDDIDCFMDSKQLQTYYENLVNEEEEIERDDEGYIDNEYPDECELSDYYTKYDDDEYDKYAADQSVFGSDYDYFN